MVIGICYVFSSALMLLLRWYLKKENVKRNQEPPDTTYDDVWVKILDEDGQLVEKKVDKVSYHLEWYVVCA